MNDGEDGTGLWSCSGIRGASTAGGGRDVASVDVVQRPSPTPRASPPLARRRVRPRAADAPFSHATCGGWCHMPLSDKRPMAYSCWVRHVTYDTILYDPPRSPISRILIPDSRFQIGFQRQFQAPLCTPFVIICTQHTGGVTVTVLAAAARRVRRHGFDVQRALAATVQVGAPCCTASPSLPYSSPSNLPDNTIGQARTEDAGAGHGAVSTFLSLPTFTS
jgi:hypothetical protein